MSRTRAASVKLQCGNGQRGGWFSACNGNDTVTTTADNTPFVPEFGAGKDERPSGPCCLSFNLYPVAVNGLHKLDVELSDAHPLANRVHVTGQADHEVKQPGHYPTVDRICTEPPSVLRENRIDDSAHDSLGGKVEVSAKAAQTGVIVPFRLEFLKLARGKLRMQ